MKAGKLLEELEEFQRLLKEFERQNRFLLGKSPSGYNDDTESQRQRTAHFSLDDYRLLLLRRYHHLRPFIETYSCCFRTVREDGTKGEEIYEVLIEKGSGDFTVLHDDLAHIRKGLSQYDPDTTLDEKGRPK